MVIGFWVSGKRSKSGKKKKANRLSYETVNPDLIELEANLNHMGINQDQLIALAMLIGTDYNSGGIKGIGPKTALKMVKQHENNFEALFKEAKWNDFFDFEWAKVFDLIKNMPVNRNYSLSWNNVNEEKIMKLLVDEHNFSEERVKSHLEGLAESKEKKGQKGLGEFFG